MPNALPYDTIIAVHSAPHVLNIVRARQYALLNPTALPPEVTFRAPPGAVYTHLRWH